MTWEDDGPGGRVPPKPEHVYLESPKIRKDETARQVAINDGVQTGLNCVLSCVEPCKS